MTQRRTKIVCTIGPASEDPAVLESLIGNGMNVARLNFSHGTHQGHARRIRDIREISGRLGHSVAVMLDTRGPEVRTGVLAGESVELTAGEMLTLTAREEPGDATRMSVSYPGLHRAVRKGDTILLDDGLISLRVLWTDDGEIACRIENGGTIRSRRGLNVPGRKLGLPFLSEKDREDILFAIREDLDFIALSFVSERDDVRQVRRILESHGSSIRLIAKIENRFGVDNILPILEESDGIMVARGDLGVEIPLEEIPVIQKRIIRACYERGRPVITATQMLDSMIRNPRPTRAEVTDVANAVLDGTDCVMLSGESAAGRYPLLALQTMDRIAREAETLLRVPGDRFRRHHLCTNPITDNICEAAVQVTGRLDARAIIVPTRSGYTPGMVAKYRPPTPVIAVVSCPRVRRQMALIWGVETVMIEPPEDTDTMIREAIGAARDAGYVREGDTVVITAGIPCHVSGTTNLLQVQIL